MRPEKLRIIGSLNRARNRAGRLTCRSCRSICGICLRCVSVRGCETLVEMFRLAGFGVLALLLGAPACDGDGADGPSRPDAALPVDAEPPTLPADAAAPVAIEYVDPDHGAFAGGTEVTLRGRGFVEGMTVRVGGRQVEALDLQVVDTRRALLKTPPGEPGLAAVEVVTSAGEAAVPDLYRYEAIYCDPPSGSIAGGTYVHLKGFGTSFAPGDVVTFDGEPMTDVTVLNEQDLAGVTPSGVSGAADVQVVGAAGTVDAHDAFVYELAGNANSGGLGGGAIHDTLNVSVVDRLTRNGIPGAFVTVGDPATSTLKGTTDAFGHITFAQPGLVGSVTVAASMPGYERGAFVDFDAAEATVWLLPLPPEVPPDPGPFPPGRAFGLVRGQILFGDVTGLGEPTWDTVPEPRSPNEHKRALVFTTSTGVYSGGPSVSPGGVIDYTGDGAIAWDFEILARPAALAVVAVAGLYDDTIDPDGDGPQPAGVFYPFVMGVARGVLVGPGEEVTNVTVAMDIPLDTSLRVELANPPRLADPGSLDGPDRYVARAFVDLGGEGVIALPHRAQTFASGATMVKIPAMPPIMSSIGDASYTIVTGAFTGEGGAPFSVRMERGIGATELGYPIVIDGFLGIPEAVDPRPGEPGTTSHLEWQPQSPTTGVASFSYHVVSLAENGNAMWRLFARPGLRDLPLYDLVTWGGMTPLPSPDPLAWMVYEIQVQGLGFDAVNYGHINANLWSAYSNHAFVVSLPPQ